MVSNNLRIFLAGVNLPGLPARRITNLLFNVCDNAGNTKMVNETKRLITFAQPQKIILDSSGFQIHLAELNGRSMTFDSNSPLITTKHRFNIAPFHVIRAACDLRPDILMGLDFPIRKLSKKEDQAKEYLFKSAFNAKWALEIVSLRRICCPEIQLFLPIQCYTVSQFDHYMNLIKGVTFNGLSMPVRNLKATQVALFFVRFHQLGVQKIHLLGTTSFSMLAVSSYFARHFFDWVSLDATTWRLAANYDQYMSPLDLSVINVAPTSIGVESIPMICQCPFCTNRSFEFIINLPYSDRRSLVSSHNFYVIEKVAQDLHDNASNLLVFEAFLRSRSRKIKLIEDLVQCLSVIDVYSEADPQVLESLLQKVA